MKYKRIIGKYGGENRGPLLICMAGIHGNETAGIKAIDLMLKMLEVEPITNPSFKYNGTFIGVTGNLSAIKAGKRYIERDLNRMWTDDNIVKITETKKSLLSPEELEIKELVRLFEKAVKDYNPTRVVLLDLHTTSAQGGIFCIPAEDDEAIKIALTLRVPVILGMLGGLKGTTLHYFRSQPFGNIVSTGLAFESGQHNDKLSVNRSIAAITNCMKAIGAVDEQHIEHHHDQVLTEYSRGLPKVTDLYYKHGINQGDQFKMRPGYSNFQKVKKGEIVADDINGPVVLGTSGYILMPLYQSQGEDGFFIVKNNLAWEKDVENKP